MVTKGHEFDPATNWCRKCGMSAEDFDRSGAPCPAALIRAINAERQSLGRPEVMV